SPAPISRRPIRRTRFNVRPSGSSSPMSRATLPGATSSAMPSPMLNQPSAVAMRSGRRERPFPVASSGRGSSLPLYGVRTPEAVPSVCVTVSMRLPPARALRHLQGAMVIPLTRALVGGGRAAGRLHPGERAEILEGAGAQHGDHAEHAEHADDVEYRRAEAANAERQRSDLERDDVQCDEDDAHFRRADERVAQVELTEDVGLEVDVD